MAVKPRVVEKWLKEGKKVRRPNWEEGSYWMLSKDGYGRILWADGTNANVHLAQLQAGDWEVVKDKVGCGENFKIGDAMGSGVYVTCGDKDSLYGGMFLCDKCIGELE